MTQRPSFSDALALNGQTSTQTSGLDFSRVEAYVSSKVGSLPTLDKPCSLAPCQISQLSAPAESRDQRDFLISDQAYGYARSAGIAGAFAVAGKPGWSKAGAGLGAIVADNLIDSFVFPDVKRGRISTIADIASIGIAFLPESSALPVIGAFQTTFLRQSLPVKMAEMVAVHFLGKMVEASKS